MDPHRCQNVNWFSTYRVHHRVADQFRKGRAFLLGDAAHIHSPVGGQGMNTGIGDAVNLAWKLAAVSQGRAHARCSTATSRSDRLCADAGSDDGPGFHQRDQLGVYGAADTVRIAPLLIPLLLSSNLSGASCSAGSRKPRSTTRAAA